MTDTEKQAIVRHLAEKVCGWTRIEKYGVWWWEPVDGSNVYPTEFNPLTDAIDCSLVMEEWAALGGQLSTNRDGYSPVWVQACKAGVVGLVPASQHITSWPEAVCLAIAMASGWEGSK